MKIIKRILLCFTIVAIFISFNYKDKNAYALTYSKGEIVMEKISGGVLYENNSKDKLPMASTTKIVTAITVIDNYDVNKIITVPKECEGVEGSSLYLKAGEKYKVLDLLYGLMLRSGNDSAETLAVCLAGSIENFCKQMNNVAKKCGAKDSNFTNPHGLHDDNHYTTAYDLAKITCYALQNQIFKEIVSAKKHQALEITSQTKKYWTNKNKMLDRYEGATGVKTGFTKLAGRCLVSSSERNGFEVVTVVLNCPSMWQRSEELLNYAYENYKFIKIIDKKKFKYTLPDIKLQKYYKLQIEKDCYYPIRNDEKIKSEINLPKCINFTPKNGQIIGEIKIYNSKQLIFSQNIYTLL